MEPIKCRVCGQIIEFARTKRGAQMPVEPGTVSICITGRKSDRTFLDEDGNLVRAYATWSDSPMAEPGRIPHFQRCRRPAENEAEKEERRAEAERIKNDTVARMLRERFGTN